MENRTREKTPPDPYDKSLGIAGPGAALVPYRPGHGQLRGLLGLVKAAALSARSNCNFDIPGWVALRRKKTLTIPKEE